MEGGLAACGDLFVRIAASGAAMTACVLGGIFLGQARLRGHIAQRFAICLRTPFLQERFFWGECSLRQAA